MDQVKRPVGRPKGTKNKPDAKNVGRPRKDGQPAQKRTVPQAGQQSVHTVNSDTGTSSRTISATNTAVDLTASPSPSSGSRPLASESTPASAARNPTETSKGAHMSQSRLSFSSGRLGLGITRVASTDTSQEVLSSTSAGREMHDAVSVSTRLPTRVASTDTSQEVLSSTSDGYAGREMHNVASVSSRLPTRVASTDTSQEVLSSTSGGYAGREMHDAASVSSRLPTSVVVDKPVQSSVSTSTPGAASVHQEPVSSSINVSSSIAAPPSLSFSAPPAPTSCMTTNPNDDSLADMNPYGSDLAAGRAVFADPDDGEEGEGGDDEEYIDEEFQEEGEEDEEQDNDDEEHEDRSGDNEGDAEGEPELRDNARRPAPSSSSTRPNQKKSIPRSTMPTWLQGDFIVMRDKLKAEMETNKHRMPDCYEHGTFYVGQPNTLLQMATGAASSIEASLFYRPTFFVWLPHLFTDRIPCPSCYSAHRETKKGKPALLQSYGWVQKPRRAVDIDRNIYIIGYRYHCGNCKRNYRSWSPAVLNVLPMSISSQFPFQLTFRSGLTDRLVALLRESFRNGIGPVPFSQMIQSFHYRRYDQLRLQFLEMIRFSGMLRGDLTRFMNAESQVRRKVTPFTAFRDRTGYAGFIPSANYFARFYDRLIEDAAPEMRQLIAMTSARVLEEDHSFKWAKRTARIKGEPVFSAINTTVNEYGEIRAAILTATKAHSQFMPVLAAIPTSLRLFGHGPTEVVFTDNVRADKNKLEQAFPSLLEGVDPVVTHPPLERLTCPKDWQHALLMHTHQVNNSFNFIMQSHTKEEPVTVAFDMEWPVDTQTGIYGRVALIQVAYKKTIYLVQTRNFMRNGFLDLPSVLLAFLRSPLYTKAGVGIGADFKRLYKDCGFKEKDVPFTGQLELGSFAKDRGAATRRNVSLSDLASTVLRRHLEKDPTIRVSTHWNEAVLHQDFIDYAVLDAFAVWAIYDTLRGSVAPTEAVTLETPGGTPVAMFSSDHKEVARGVIALDRPRTFDGVNVSSTRVIMTVSEVLVPGYLIKASLLLSKTATPLSAFGPPSFTILVDRRNLRTRSISPTTSTPNHKDNNVAQDIAAAIDQASFQLSDVLQYAQSQAADGLWDDEYDARTISERRQSNMVDERSNESVGLGDHALDLSEPEQRVENSLRDPEADAAAATLLAQYRDIDPSTVSRVFSRVLGDIFHLHNKFPISLHHGLRRPFARALSTAIFLPDPKDKAAVEAILQKQGTSYNSKLLSRPKWVLRRVRRYVPPPHILLPRVSLVIQTFGALKDSTTSAPLFNDKAWEIAKNVLENIRLGYYSDPPGVQLYYDMGCDKNGLRQYRCCRGTNAVEGGVHQNLIRCFTSFNVSPRHAVNSLLDYAICHNIQVGTRNRTNKEYAGHFDVPLKNKVAHLLDITAELFTDDGLGSRGQWVNGNDYMQAGEVFGIMPFDVKTRETLQMLPFNPQLAKTNKFHHAYLSQQQGTMFAVLPVHTKPERDLYQLMVGMTSHFTGTAQPNWMALAGDWSGHCDGKVIFYKLPEHLKGYFKTWTDIRNEQNSLNTQIEAYRQVRALLKLPTGLNLTIPVAVPAVLQDDLILSEPSIPAEQAGNWQIVANLLSDHRQAQLLKYRYYAAESGASETNTGTPTARSKARGKKRAAADGREDDIEDPGSKKSSKPRTCVHCKGTDCPGRWGFEKCPLYKQYYVQQALATEKSSER